jgi:hydrogenase expression/formation protein HypC
MCLGIPGKVVEINDGALKMARVDFGGVRKEACLEYVPETQIGDYVIVHVGFAISRVDEEEALRTLELLRMIDELALEQELGAMPDEPAAAPGAAPGASA